METIWYDNSRIPISDGIYQAPSITSILKTPIGDLIKSNPDLIVFSEGTNIGKMDKESILSGCDDPSNPDLWTGNLMGVLYIKQVNNFHPLRISINSRFDKGSDSQTFLTWMLIHAFDGMIHSWKPRAGVGIWRLLLIFLFKYYLEKAYHQGLYKQYISRKYNDFVFKGVLDVSRHIKMNSFFTGRVACNVREHSFDNPVLWLVRHAANYISLYFPELYTSILLSKPITNEALRVIVEATPSYTNQNQYHLFYDCQIPIRHPFFTEYENLRKISLQLLRNEGLTLYSNSMKDEVYGVLFDGAWLWEKFLASVLRPLNFKHMIYSENKEVYVFENPRRSLNLRHSLNLRLTGKILLSPAPFIVGVNQTCW
jgi:hypothetical protein